MRTKMIAGFMTLVAALTLGGCGWKPSSSRNPTEGGRSFCPPGLEHAEYFSADLYRPLDGGGYGVVAMSAALTIAVRAGDPDFGGTWFVDGVVTLNPRVITRDLPYTGRACMPPDKPVSWLWRVTLNDIPDQAYDELQCRMQAGSVPGAGGNMTEGVERSSQRRRIDPADLIPGAPPVQVQCLWTWIPDGWSGPVPSPFKPL